MARKNMLGGSYNAESLDSIKDEHKRRVEGLREDVYADGYPPFAAKLNAHEQLARLEALRKAGDPRSMTVQAEQDRQKLIRQVQG